MAGDRSEDEARDPGSNPFYVLEVRPGATATEVERAGQKLLAMLTVGLADAGTYQTPVGARPRDADTVRQALDELRDPSRRWVHELFAALPPDVAASVAPPARPDPWPEALAALGWRSPPGGRGTAG
jgi:hypothetical protein